VRRNVRNLTTWYRRAVRIRTLTRAARPADTPL